MTFVVRTVMLPGDFISVNATCGSCCHGHAVTPIIHARLVTPVAWTLQLTIFHSQSPPRLNARRRLSLLAYFVVDVPACHTLVRTIQLDLVSQTFTPRFP